MPICIISPENRTLFANHVKKIYKRKISSEFEDWVSNTFRPLVCVMGEPALNHEEMTRARIEDLFLWQE